MTARKRQAQQCLLRLEDGSAVVVELPYDVAREKVRLATEEGYLHVELPVNWSGNGDKARDSLVALRHIVVLAGART